jgi:hypothetical protein
MLTARSDDVQVVSDGPMRLRRWFPGARLNHAEHALPRSGSDTAIHGRSHTRGASELSWDELRAAVARCLGALQPGIPGRAGAAGSNSACHRTAGLRTQSSLRPDSHFSRR